MTSAEELLRLPNTSSLRGARSSAAESPGTSPSKFGPKQLLDKMLRSFPGSGQKAPEQQQHKPEEQTSHGNTSEDQTSEGSSENEFRAKRSRARLTEEEYEFIARDIMSKPPLSGYLKYHLPLKYAARTEEVRWVWNDPNTGRLTHKELIGGGKNSDLEYD